MGVTKVKNILLIASGFVMLVLGVIGIVLPLLPTTPFILVAAVCFASTPKLYGYVIQIPLINEYIVNYKTHKGVSKKAVIVSLTFLWVTLTISAVAIKRVWIILCLAAVGAAVTTHVILVSKPGR